MALLKSIFFPLRMPLLPLCFGLCFLLSSPVDAWAGWFYRDNQIAYRMYRAGHDRQALAYWDKSAQGWFGKGAALMHLGRMHDAEQAFRQSLALMPKIQTSDAETGPIDNPDFVASVWYNLGNALYAQGELLQASQAWRSALNYEPEHAKARHNLEVVKRLLGKGKGDDEAPPPALSRHARKERHGDAQPASSGKGSGKKQTASGAQQKKMAQRQQPHAESSPGGKRHKRKSGNASQQASANGSGQAKKKTGQGGHPRMDGVTTRQAENELRLVKEGVSVFLRHRLGEKKRGASVYRGPAW